MVGPFSYPIAGKHQPRCNYSPMQRAQKIMARFLVFIGFMANAWPGSWRSLNISCLELFPITLSVHLWGDLMAIQRVVLFLPTTPP